MIKKIFDFVERIQPPKWWTDILLSMENNLILDSLIRGIGALVFATAICWVGLYAILKLTGDLI